ncbi:hypothetical protein [Paenibacillus sp. FSL R10-2734]|uniref:hypothetical protein n=1 Tax=Paenibacillus sp. FSL R10-2734 TaxID=2954691 RepID=UPI0030D82FED
MEKKAKLMGSSSAGKFTPETNSKNKSAKFANAIVSLSIIVRHPNRIPKEAIEREMRNRITNTKKALSSSISNPKKSTEKINPIHPNKTPSMICRTDFAINKLLFRIGLIKTIGNIPISLSLAIVKTIPITVLRLTIYTELPINMNSKYLYSFPRKYIVTI